MCRARACRMHTHIHTLLWCFEVEKAPELCTFPTSFTLHNTNIMAQVQPITTHKGRGWELIFKNEASQNKLMFFNV